MVGRRIIICSLLIALISIVAFFYMSEKDNYQTDSSAFLRHLKPTIQTNYNDVISNGSVNSTAKTVAKLDYYSVKTVFDAFQPEASELLKEYKYHESHAETSAESQYALYWMRISCLMSPNIEVQQDLDHWILEVNTPPNRIDNHVQSVMRQAGRCNKLRRYLGNDNSNEFILATLESAANNGHPIAKLSLAYMRKFDSMRTTDITKLFREAYEYSKDHPQYAPEVYGAVGRYLLKLNRPDKKHELVALSIIGNRGKFASRQHLDPEKVDIYLLHELEHHLLPWEIDSILAKVTQLSEAMENGDWSFLKLADNEP